MSGYLHRLAASAIQPQPRVHPFVESIYPAVRREKALEFSPVIQAAQPSVRASSSEPTGQRSVPEAEAPVFRPDSRPARSASPPSSLQPTLRLGEGELPVEAISASSEAFQPLLPQLVMRPQETESPRSAAARESDTAAESAARPAGPTSSSAAASESFRHAVTPLRRWTFESILESITAERASAGQVSSENPQCAVAARRDLPVFSARAASRPAAASIAPARRTAPLQPEDIQIHIGRIEVTAVPPQAPCAVPAAARKGLTLDEYLRGSNGRAR